MKLVQILGYKKEKRLIIVTGTYAQKHLVIFIVIYTSVFFWYKFMTIKIVARHLKQRTTGCQKLHIKLCHFNEQMQKRQPSEECRIYLASMTSNTMPDNVTQ